MAARPAQQESDFSFHFHFNKDKGANRILHSAKKALKYYNKVGPAWSKGSGGNHIIKVKHLDSDLVFTTKDPIVFKDFVERIVNGRR